MVRAAEPTPTEIQKPMEPAQIVDREARYGKGVAVVGLVGALLVFGATFSGLASDFLRADGAADQLIEFEAVSSEYLLAQILLAIGTLMLSAPLFFLFQAAMDRNPAMRRGLLGLTVIAPAFVAAAFIASYFGFDAAAQTFADLPGSGVDADQLAEDTLSEEGAYNVFLGLRLAGLLGIIIALVYTSLQAMRVGLLTRFGGTLGMALGVGFLFLGPLSFAVWGVAASLAIGGLMRGPRPPAWETGEAVPWPKPGEVPPPAEEELADASEFEGSGRELDGESDDEPAPSADGGGPDEGPTGRPADSASRRKRKRKQRE
jgi:hypothetical protein